MDFGLPISILIWTPFKLSALGRAQGCSRQGEAAPLLLLFWLGKGSWGVLGHSVWASSTDIVLQLCGAGGSHACWPGTFPPNHRWCLSDGDC